MGSGIRRPGPGLRDRKPSPWDRDQQFFPGIRDQDVTYLWDQGRKWVTLLESRIRNLRTKMGEAKKNIPRYDPVKTKSTRRVFLFCHEKFCRPAMGTVHPQK